MKTILNTFWILTLLIAGACSNSTPVDKTKSSSFKLQATAVPKTSSTSGRVFATKSGKVEISFAQVSIANIRIEENSGNDNDSGVSEVEGTEGVEAPEGVEGTETENDLLLPGPYTLELSNNLALISNVNVFPGTYKKVNFKFVSGNGSAILIRGNFINGTVTTPFTLTSTFNKTVQLPLSNGGVVVTANSTKDISIIFDINSWFASLDLSTATLTNGEILIDMNSNKAILSAFEDVLLQHIDAED